MRCNIGALFPIDAHRKFEIARGVKAPMLHALCSPTKRRHNTKQPRIIIMNIFIIVYRIHQNAHIMLKVCAGDQRNAASASSADLAAGRSWMAAAVTAVTTILKCKTLHLANYEMLRICAPQIKVINEVEWLRPCLCIAQGAAILKRGKRSKDQQHADKE